MSLKLYDETSVQAIADAIREKNGSSDTYTIGGMAQAIQDIPTGEGGESAPINDVNFYDYDGTIVKSYTKDQFLELNKMPGNPAHDRLIAQGWNYSLEDAKSYVRKYGVLDIGQMYKTASGAMELDIELNEGRLSPYLGLGINGTVTVDWGDGSEISTMTGSNINTVIYAGHTYTSTGNYTIKCYLKPNTTAMISGSSNKATLLSHNKSNLSNQSISYRNSLRGIYLIDSVSLNNWAFADCFSLTNINIPNGVNNIPNGACRNCTSLIYINIPNSVTLIAGGAFFQCYSLRHITLPKGLSNTYDSIFFNCYSLRSIVLPTALVAVANMSFYGANSITSIIIPAELTNINDQAFCNCYALASIKFTSKTPPKINGSNHWSGISSDCKIYVPSGTLADYKATSGMPNPSTYTYIEYDIEDDETET